MPPATRPRGARGRGLATARTAGDAHRRTLTSGRLLVFGGRRGPAGRALLRLGVRHECLHLWRLIA